MDATDKDHLKQLDELLASGNQTWLFGAGISLNANIPLMAPLTSQVMAKASIDSDKRVKELLDAIKAMLSDDSHIEHILSHMGDFAAIADRSKTKKVVISGIDIELSVLQEMHAKVQKWIAETIRWGYRPAYGGHPEKVGTAESPIVTIAEHLEFMSALFNRSQAGIEDRRRAVRLFTTNYDTLLEDALALKCFPFWDGFLGGAVAYRSHRYGEDEPSESYRAHVIKLHGSIDWHLGNDDRVWRVRDRDLYPDKSTRVLIYPQSNKYLATQRDPFAAQFDLFRRTLNAQAENVLATCGYSFGDEHINQEIEISLQLPESKTTVIAFTKDISELLRRWQSSSWARRLYIVCESGLYVGNEGPFFAPGAGKRYDWWTFSGVTKVLNSGAEASLS